MREGGALSLTRSREGIYFLKPSAALDFEILIDQRQRQTLGRDVEADHVSELEARERVIALPAILDRGRMSERFFVALHRRSNGVVDRALAQAREQDQM